MVFYSDAFFPLHAEAREFWFGVGATRENRKRRRSWLYAAESRTGLWLVCPGCWSQDYRRARVWLPRQFTLTFIAVPPMPALLTLAFVGFMAGSACTTARLADS